MDSATTSTELAEDERTAMQPPTTTTQTSFFSRTGVRIAAGALYVVLAIMVGLGIGGALTATSTRSTAEALTQASDPGAEHKAPEASKGTPATQQVTPQAPTTPEKKPAAVLPDSLDGSAGTAAPSVGDIELPPGAGNPPEAGTTPTDSSAGSPPASSPHGPASPPGGAPPTDLPGAGDDASGTPEGPPDNGDGSGPPPPGPGTVPGEPGDGGTPPANTGATTVTVPAAGNDSLTLDEDTAATASVLDNDSGSIDSLAISGGASHGTATVEGDAVVYEPDHDFHGSDTFSYEICNAVSCSMGTVNVTVNSVNDAPTVLDIAESTISRGSSYSGCVLQVIHDVDGDALSIESVGTPSPHGSAEIVSTDVCQAITYHHPGGLAGVVVIPFTAGDGHGGTVSAEWHITVVNDAPVVADETYELDLSVSLSWCLPVLANDSDPNGDALTIVTVSAYEGTAIEPGTCPEGQIHYTAFSDPFLPPFDTIEYTVTDGYAGAATGVVHISFVSS